MSKVSVLDLFSGAGGFSVAAAMAGADVCGNLEIDPTCSETLRLNGKWHKGEILTEDITAVDGRQLRRRLGLTRAEPLIVIGGAPCQPFSKAAYWTDPGDDARFRRARSRGERASRPTQQLPPRPDLRRTLVQDFWRIVRQTQAAGFVFENVPSILHPRNRKELEQLRKTAHASGFFTQLIVANAAEFGVAQRRTRVFLLGSTKRQPLDVSPTHRLAPDDPSRLPLATSAIDVISRFSGREFFEPEEIVSGRWADHLRTVPPGGNYKAHTAWAGHPKPTFETETRFWNFLLKLHPERPSWTIAASPGPWTGPFHWSSRRLRTPELAALQGFPIGYRFSGTRRDRVRQIGNAVPPGLAAPIVGSVIASIKGRASTRSGGGASHR